MSVAPSLLVVDDHLIVYSGIKLLLQAHHMQMDVQSCQNVYDCVDLMNRQKFDILVMDVNLPDTDTFQLVETILKQYPEQKILMYSMSSEAMYARRFMDLGAMAYVSKQASNEEFIEAVQTILSGQLYKNSSRGNGSNLQRLESNNINKNNSKKEEDDNRKDRIDSTFFVKDEGSYRLIHLDEVEYFKLEGKYAKIICKNGTYSLRTTMNDLEDRISNGFIRVHGTILVNKTQIHSIKPKDQNIYLKNGDVIPFSRHFKKNLFENIVIT